MITVHDNLTNVFELEQWRQSIHSTVNNNISLDFGFSVAFGFGFGFAYSSIWYERSLSLSLQTLIPTNIRMTRSLKRSKRNETLASHSTPNNMQFLFAFLYSILYVQFRHLRWSNSNGTLNIFHFTTNQPGKTHCTLGCSLKNQWQQVWMQTRWHRC